MFFSQKDLFNFDINKLIKKKEIIIGLDVGDKTIGVSVSDFRIKIASPLFTVHRKNIDYDCKNLLNNLKNYNIGLIVFGWPVHLDGKIGLQCEKILQFIEKLSEHISVDFIKWDERFSTSVVTKIMIQANLSRKRRKELIDKSSAVYILQGLIDFLNRKNNLLVSLD